MNVLSMSKLGRWFSWQDCAHEQLPEFFASKMLLEDHVVDADPDETEAARFFGRDGRCGDGEQENLGNVQQA